MIDYLKLDGTMAEWIIWTTEQVSDWNAWVASRPKFVQDLCKSHPGNKLYDLRGQKVRIHSYHEDGTLTVNIDYEYNQDRLLPGGIMDKSVFGVAPSSLVECDLPDYIKPVDGSTI